MMQRGWGWKKKQEAVIMESMEEIGIVKERISSEKREKIRDETRDFVKVVVDIEREVLALGSELHIDCYERLIEDGSKPENLWGANVYFGEARIDCVSLVNIRPPVNRSMEVRDEKLQTRIEAVARKLLF